MKFNYMTELSATILELIYENNKDSVTQNNQPVNGEHQHQTDTACSWLVCHSRGDCSGNTVQIVSTYPASPEDRPPSFFGKPAVRSRSMAGGAPTPCGRHWVQPRTKANTQDPYTHPTTHTHQVHWLFNPIPSALPAPTLHSPPTTQNTHLHLLSTGPHAHSLHPRPNTTCPYRLSPHFPTTQTSTRPHTCTLPHTQQTKLNTRR